MYQRPRLERYGTFRELTLLGNTGATDGQSFFGTDGNNLFAECTVVNGQLRCS